MLKQVLLVALAFLFAMPFFVSAQETTPLEPPAFLKDVKTEADLQKLTPEQRKEAEEFFRSVAGPSLANPQVAAPENTVNCFDSYTFGSVQVDVEPSVGSTVPGVPITFSGKLKNDNPYPLVDGSVMVKIFRIDGGDDSLVHQNGYPVVDQFFAKENISLPAKGEKPVSFDWNIPAFAQSGEYQLAAYFMTAKRFNLLGLPFTDDVTGNKASFRIASGMDSGVSFDKNAVTLNGQTYRFAAFPPHFTKDESVKAEVKLKNSTNQPQSVTLTWTLSNWAGEREENMLDRKTETVTLAPNETKSLSYETAKATGSVSFLNVAAQYEDTKSLLNIRFVRDGFDETRLNFPSVMSYPLEAGKQNTVFSCLHSTNASIVNDGELTLTLKDTKGNLIHAYTYQGGVTGAMMGVKDGFTPKKTYADFTLTATLKNRGKTVEEVTETYSCREIDPSLCPSDSAFDGAGSNIGKGAILSILGVLVLLLGLLGWKIWKDRKPNAMKAFTFLFATIVSATLLFGGAGEAEAKSVTWDSGVFIFTQSPGIYKITAEVSARVLYGAEIYNTSGSIIPDNSVVPVNSKIRVVPSFQITDTSWMIFDEYVDTPYGCWSKGAVYVSSCPTQDILWYPAVSMSVNTPDLTLEKSGTASLDCDAENVCTVRSPGSIKITQIFNSSYLKFYSDFSKADPAYAAYLSMLYPGFDYILTFPHGLNIPRYTLSWDLTAVQTNQAPSVPEIRGSADMTAPAPPTGNAGSPVTLYFRSADPDGDNLKYEVDWDGIGIGADPQPVPSTGYVPQNTAQSASRTWALPGTYSVNIRAVDDNGTASGWASHGISIVNAPVCTGLPLNAAYYSGDDIGLSVDTPSVYAALNTPTIKCEFSCNTGYQWTGASCVSAPTITANFSVNDTTPDYGDPLTFTWSSTGADRCFIQGYEFISTNDLGPSGNAPKTAIQTSSYTLTCENSAFPSVPPATQMLSVNVNCSSCTAWSDWSACSGGTQSRSCVSPACQVGVTQSQACTVPSSGTTWKEVAP